MSDNEFDRFDLNRFIKAHSNGMFEFVIDELHGGRKRTHWMWFMFPQLKHLGYSLKARYYGISGRDEAKAYLAHPLLASRLIILTEIAISLPSNNPEEIFGPLDSKKFRSCMTLFDAVMPGDVFRKALDKFYNGVPDFKTIELLN